MTLSEMKQEILRDKTTPEAFCSSIYWVASTLFQYVEEGRQVDGIDLSKATFINKPVRTCCSLELEQKY